MKKRLRFLKRKLGAFFLKAVGNLKEFLKKFLFKENFNFNFRQVKLNNYFKIGTLKFLFKNLRLVNFFILVLSPLAFLGIYYFLAFISISPKEICLEALKISFEEDKYCRDECALKRLENKNCVIHDFKIGTKSSRLEKKIFSYLKDENLDFNFRRELVDVFRIAYKDLETPSFLVAYLEGEKGDDKIKAEIFKAFDFEFIASNPLSYYLAIINSEASLELRLAAALKISSYPEKALAFSLGDLNIFREVIFNSKTPNYLRQSLVLLLGDYRFYFPQEAEVLLAEIEGANFKSDNISRAFAADFIGREIPEISPEEWSLYYNR